MRQTTDRLDEIAGRLKAREEARREYEVVDDADEASDDGFMPSWLYDEDYEQGMNVRQKYLSAYEGKMLSDAISGKVVSNSFGDCYCIRDSCTCSPSKLEAASSRKALLSSLRLLHGIGPDKEAKLKSEGYRSIEDLLEHPRWKRAAQKFIDLVDSQDPCQIQEELWHWLPRSHPLNLHVSAFADVDRLTAIDIETMGLFSRPIILFGAAIVRDGNIETVQYLARSIEEEAAAIEAFCSLVSDNPILSYNGRAFDVPYVNQRKWFYDIPGKMNNLHFDMLHFARRAFKGRFPDARLVTIEKHLFGHERIDDVPGAMVPEFYETYLSSGNPGPLVPIVEHNRQDIIALARLYHSLCEGECNVCRR